MCIQVRCVYLLSAASTVIRNTGKWKSPNTNSLTLTIFHGLPNPLKCFLIFYNLSYPSPSPVHTFPNSPSPSPVLPHFSQSSLTFPNAPSPFPALLHLPQSSRTCPNPPSLSNSLLLFKIFPHLSKPLHLFQSFS